MSSNNSPIDHGTFAEGEAHPESDASEGHVGNFADGSEHPVTQ
jgi:hypothetical protein